MRKLFFITIAVILSLLVACSPEISATDSATFLEKNTVYPSNAAMNAWIQIRRETLPKWKSGVLFPYRSEDGACKYRNMTGEINILVPFSDFLCFSDYCAVRWEKNELFVMNTQGKSCTIKKRDNELWGEIVEDANGNFFIEILSSDDGDIEIVDTMGEQYLFIRQNEHIKVADKQGNVVIELPYMQYVAITEDVVWCWDDNGGALVNVAERAVYTVNSQYEVMFETVSHEPADYSGGLVSYSMRDNEGEVSFKGFIDLKGKEAFLTSFPCSEFNEGAAVMYCENSVSYIGTDGSPLFEKHFAVANNFSEGLALASVDGEKYGYIDKTGEFVIEPMYDLGALSIVLEDDGTHAYSYFHNGYAMVANAEEGWAAYIDKTGKEVFRFFVGNVTI